MNLLRLRRPEVLFDFVATQKGVFDEEARALGAKIHYIPFRRPCYPRNREFLRNIISGSGYDVVHFHLNDFAGTVLQVAAECGVPVRINHAHNTGFGNPYSPAIRLKKAYWSWIDRPRVGRYATHLLACSREAGRTLFGPFWRTDHTSRVVYYGIPTEPFEHNAGVEQRRALRKRYGFREDAIVVGNLGRLAYQKNQGFLLHVFAELARRDERYALFIGGEGERRSELTKQAASLALDGRIAMPGSCDNIHELICGLFDVFFLPSHFEGLSVALLESTAGGLYNVCSEVVPDDLFEQIPDRFTALPLSASPSVWCDAIEQGIRNRIRPEEGVARFRRTPFTIERSMESLLKVYGAQENAALRGDREEE